MNDECHDLRVRVDSLINEIQLLKEENNNIWEEIFKLTANQCANSCILASVKGNQDRMIEALPHPIATSSEN